MKIFVVAVLSGACGLLLGVAAGYSLNRPATASEPGKQEKKLEQPSVGQASVERMLEKLDMPRRYNESIAWKAREVGGPKVDDKIGKWMRELWIEHLGWEKSKASIIKHYQASFTDAELKEIVGILDQPLPKKLMPIEAQALEATSQERADRFAKFWQRYNDLEFQPPR